MSVTPVFIFSLPRCGSTLTQRLLAARAEVATSSEPWLLLPLLYARRDGGAYSEYGHYLAVSALRDFCAECDGGEAAYQQALRNFVLDLYAKAAGEARYFVDKTPRYHLIAEEVMQLFPEAKCIFLWRHPLAMIASMVETFGKGRWMLYVLKVDLFDGLDNLTRAFAAAPQSALGVRYEDLVQTPEDVLGRLLEYLELPADAELSQRFADTELKGTLGDQAGSRAYQTISAEPLQKWTGVLGNPVRKLWCRRYLRWIGRERLAAMGYDLDVLLAELRAAPFSLRFLVSDIGQLLFAWVYAWVEPAMLRDKFRKLPRLWRVHGHR